MLRPTNGYRPAQDDFVFHCREAETINHDKPDGLGGVQRAWNQDLWLHGNREYKDSNGTLSYRSVSIKIIGNRYFVYFCCSGMDHDTITALVAKINESNKFAITDGWETLRLKNMVLFDYDAFLKDPTKYPERPYVKLYLKNPTCLYTLRKATQAPLEDHRGRQHKIHLIHDRLEWSAQFMTTQGVRIQSWCRVKDRSKLQPVTRRETCSNEEYTLYAMDPVLEPVSEKMGAPALCATMRCRFGTTQAKPSAATTQDTLLALSSNVYWTGHDGGSLKLDLYVGDEDEDIPEEDGVIRKAYANQDLLLQQWKQMMRVLSVDVYLTLEDVQADLAYVVNKLPCCNLSRFNNYQGSVKPNPRARGRYYFRTPGVTIFNIQDYMKKLMIRPSFEGYGLVDAYSHPKIYNGPERPSLEDHNPYKAQWQSVAERIQELRIEADILQYVEDGPNLYLDAAALAKVCNVSTQRIVSNGQTVRVTNLLYRNCHRWGWVMDSHRLKTHIPIVVPSAEKNSFPNPPELLNVALRYRDENYDRLWKESIEKNPLHPDMPIQKIKEAPDPDSFPETIVMLDEEGKRYVRPDLKARFEAGTQTNATDYKTVDLHGNTVQVGKKRGLGRMMAPKRAKIMGGFVADPHEGFYDRKDEVPATEDFASLYPSIMQAERYCYSTLAADQRVVNDPRLTKKYIEISPGDCAVHITHVNGVLVPTVLPDTEKELVAERKRLKGCMKTAAISAKQLKQIAEGSATVETLVDAWKPRSPEERKAKVELVQKWFAMTPEDRKKEMNYQLRMVPNYDKAQLGSKITQNSVYGYTGAEVGEMYCSSLSASITSTGQWMIRLCSWYVIRYYKGARIYGVSNCALIIHCNAF